MVSVCCLCDAKLAGRLRRRGPKDDLPLEAAALSFVICHLSVFDNVCQALPVFFLNLPSMATAMAQVTLADFACVLLPQLRSP